MEPEDIELTQEQIDELLATVKKPISEEEKQGVIKAKKLAIAREAQELKARIEKSKTFDYKNHLRLYTDFSKERYLKIDAENWRFIELTKEGRGNEFVSDIIRKFTPKRKRELIARINKYTPEMSPVNHKRIGKFVGPLYVGIVFTNGRGVGAYLDSTLYSTTLAQRNIKNDWSIHGFIATMPNIASDYPDDVIEEVVSQSLKPEFTIKLEGPTTIDDIFDHFRKISEKTGGGGYSRYFTEGTSPALIAAFAGEMEKANDYFKWLTEVWRDTLSYGRNAREKGNLQATEIKYVDEYEDAAIAIKDPELLRHNFFESVKALKLEKANYQDIEGSPYKAKEEFERLFR